MGCVFHSKLPEDLVHLRPLPGVQPLKMADWLVADEVYAAQMRERERLIAACPDLVHGRCAGSEEAVEEALALILAQLSGRAGYERQGGQMLCPDGRSVDLSEEPLIVMGRLIQEDICIMQKPDGADEHILTAAILCFPAHWTLSEKLGKPMIRIHAPVPEYDAEIAKRVQRLFDGVQTGRPLWRFNRAHAGPELFKPRSEADLPEVRGAEVPGVLRAERQSLIRLPVTKAVIFSIHTYVVQSEEAA